MYSPDAIIVTAPAISNPFWYLVKTLRFSNHPTAQAPSAIGIARPSENASNSTAPNSGDAIAAAAPSKTTNAGVQTGQTATEKTNPRANAPHIVVGRFMRGANIAGKGTRTHPGHMSPKMIRSGPSRRPHWRPTKLAAQLPPNPAMKPSNTWAMIIAAVKATPNAADCSALRALVT